MTRCSIVARAMLAATLVLAGCAHRIGDRDELARLKPAADPYSRNSIVCVPTALGNLAGTPGAIVWLAVAPLHNERLSKAVGVGLAGAPALAVGAITGLPFIPLSHLKPEVPCHFSPFGVQ